MRAALVGIALEGKRPPEVYRFTVRYAVIFVAGMLGAGRHDAGDGERPGIEHDLAAEDVGVGGKTVAPQAVAQNHLLLVAGDFIVER
jgi:hypothetical protein